MQRGNRLSSLMVQLNLIAIGLLALTLTGCAGKVVPPYDERLVKDTEIFFKKANALIEEGKAVSPLKDEERNKIDKPADHPGHISAFTKKYDALLLDSDALILRAIINSQMIDSYGGDLRMKIHEVIAKSAPSTCQELLIDLGKVDVTAMNFVDLKCTVLSWKARHGDDFVTKGKYILKKANWEGRKIVLIDIIQAFQQGEGFTSLNKFKVDCHDKNQCS